MIRVSTTGPSRVCGPLLALLASVQTALFAATAVANSGPPAVPLPSGGDVNVVYTNVPGAPNSNVPGLSGASFRRSSFPSTDFKSIHGSPGGDWILIADSDLPVSEDRVVIVNGALVLREGTPAPWSPTETIGEFDLKCDMNSHGDFVLSLNRDDSPTDFDTIVKNEGGQWSVEAREFDPIPWIPGEVFGLVGAPLLLDSGETGFTSSGPALGAADNYLFLSSTTLLQGVVSVPPGQNGGAWILTFDRRGYFASADGAQWMVEASLLQQPGLDDVVIVDGTIRVQEGFVVPNSGFAQPVDSSGISATHMDAAGNWFVRGQNDAAGLASGLDWILRNGAVLVRTGDPVVPGSQERWDDAMFSRPFFLNVGNGNGDHVVGGVTDAPADRSSVLVFNGSEVICRRGDPVDLDGNGAFDDGVFVQWFGTDKGHLTDDRVLYTTVTLQGGAGNSVGEAFISIDVEPSLGTNYCTAVANSTGAAASITAQGSIVAADNDLTLLATGMPAQQFGIFVTSQTQGATPIASGNLCVAGDIVRFQGPGQILQSDLDGEFSLQVDTTALPAGVPTPILQGETWSFTAWYRDTNAMGPTANFSDAVEITFE